MTKKDYKIIAEALRRKAGGNYVDIGEIINVIANALAEDNPRFDRNKFQDACWNKTKK